MLGFNNLNQNADTIVAEAYGIECDGHWLALEEARSVLADIIEEQADLNNHCIDAVAEGMQTGGPEGYQAALEAFSLDPVMEGFLKSAKDRIVSALKSMKAKIVAFFESAVKYFDALWKSGKDFASKYEEELKQKDLNGFKYEMFQYKMDAISIKNIFSRCKDAINKKESVGTGDTNRKQVTGEVMHSLCGENVRDRSAFVKAIVKKMRSGATQKREVSPNIAEIIKALMDGEELAECKDAKKDCEDSFDEVISKIDDSAKGLEDGNKDGAKLVRAQYTKFLDAKEIAMSAFDAYKSVVKERNSAYKSCLSKALHFSAKKSD